MHCYQAFLCYWDGYHLIKYNEPYSAQMVPTDPSGSCTKGKRVLIVCMDYVMLVFIPWMYSIQHKTTPITNKQQKSSITKAKVFGLDCSAAII